MKKWMVNGFSLVLATGLLAACGEEEGTTGTVDGGEAEAETTSLKLAHVLPDSEIHAQAAVEFESEVEELSGGALDIEIFGNATLGDDLELIEGLELGTTDIWVGGAGVLSSISETAQIFTVPFLFRDQEHFEAVYNGEVGEEISDTIAEESGVRILSYWTRGPRNLTVNKEVVTPADLEGLKIRVPDSPVFVQSFEALGAAPTPMAFGEVFTALQQGVIDGQENPLSLIYNSKFYEVVDYLVMTEHVREPIVMVMNNEEYEALTSEQQEALSAAANGAAQEFVATEVAAGEEEYLGLLEEAGMTVVEPDLEAFSSQLDGFVEENFPEVQDTYEQITAVE